MIDALVLEALRPLVAQVQNMVRWYGCLPLVTRHAIYNHVHAQSRSRCRAITRRKQRGHW